MKKASLCLLVALAFAACNKPAPEEEAEVTPVPKKNTPVASQRLSPTPASTGNDWMWKNAKGKPRSNNSLGVKDNALDDAPKRK